MKGRIPSDSVEVNLSSQIHQRDQINRSQWWNRHATQNRQSRTNDSHLKGDLTNLHAFREVSGTI
jgi:hypothetical protein